MIAGLADRISAAARQGTCAVALRHQLSRQYRCAETGRGHRPDLAVGLRFVQGGPPARHFRARRSVRRPHPQAREFVLRQGLRCPCLDGPSGVAAAVVHLAAAAKAEGIAAVQGGTYVCMEGPQFSSLAESLTYKSQGYSVIGMTNMPEAKLAREAEICYASVAMVTDFDCWHPDHDAVTVQDIIRVLNSNADKAKGLVARLARDFPRQHEPCPIGSDRALDTALITAPEARDPHCLRSSMRWPGGCCGHEGRRQAFSQYLARARWLVGRRDRPAAAAARICRRAHGERRGCGATRSAPCWCAAPR